MARPHIKLLRITGTILALACGSVHVAGADQSPSSTDAAEAVNLPVQQVAPPAAEQFRDIDPIALYGGDIVFDVYRKKSRIGEHRVSFQRDGDRLTVSVKFNLAVKILFIRAYKFEYEATEIWERGNLIAATSRTDDNGKVSNVRARSEGGVFVIDGPRGQEIASSWVFPSNHWNRGQVASTTLLNTITGRLAHVALIRNGIDRVETAQGPVNAEHFTYTGDLRDTDVWYDQAGRWVKMVFKTGGSVIEYRCRQCSPLEDAQLQASAAKDGEIQPVVTPGTAP
ncbi:MAG: hypothetical protein KDE14_11235 [Rhodobacteraceae bacterium]|nr:hypothetical protein [Paracoccaceae bacterium]